MLTDNTSEDSVQVGFDAIRVQPTDFSNPMPTDPQSAGGCCQTGSGSGSGVLALGVFFFLRRRQTDQRRS